ncbi:MAG: DUF934 domain-containing protein [Pseudomonadota bacterium]
MTKLLKWDQGTLIEGQDEDVPSLSLEHDVDSTQDMPDLSGVERVVLTFPAFRDGRAFTQAQVLRQLGFEGDIRATGALFLDQYSFALRCGFTSFEVGDNTDVEGIMESVNRFPAFYQSAAAGRALWEKRAGEKRG